MAKTALINRNEKRRETVKKLAAKRAELLARLGRALDGTVARLLGALEPLAQRVDGPAQGPIA